MRRTLLLLVAPALLIGCAHSKIRGTDIDDTADNHAIIDTIDAYRKAVEAKDVQGIAFLLDPSFKDDGGSTNPDDDLDYKSVSQKLTDRFAKLDNVRLDIDIRKIQIKDDLASCVYHYDTRFTILGANGAKLARSDSEIKEMALRRVDHAWKITSGI